jgi:hypothetical protein
MVAWPWIIVAAMVGACFGYLLCAIIAGGED